MAELYRALDEAVPDGLRQAMRELLKVPPGKRVSELERLRTGLVRVLILAHGPGVYFQPSMNQHMWNSPGTRRTIELLTAYGHHILEGPPTPTLTSDNPTGGIGAIPGTVLATAAAHRQRHQR